MNSKCKDVSEVGHAITLMFCRTDVFPRLPEAALHFDDGSAGAERNGGALPPAHAASGAGCYPDNRDNTSALCFETPVNLDDYRAGSVLFTRIVNPLRNGMKRGESPIH